MNILCLGVGFFVGAIFAILILSLCAAAKRAERKMAVNRNFHLAEYREQAMGNER